MQDRKVKRILSSFISFSLFLLFAACSQDMTVNQYDTSFEIKKGDSIREVSKNLKQESIIKNPLRFQIIAKLMRHDRDFKFGIYQIRKGESYYDLIAKFSAGQTYSIKITIPEGYNIFQVADLLSSKNLASEADFLRECSNTAYLQQYDLNGLKSVEGLIYPETYLIPIGSPSEKIIPLFLTQFDRVVDRPILDEINKKGLSLKKVLTMASIIVKEARFEFEKPIIAGVYYNRLKKGMKLQADPTLIYALMISGKYEGEILYSDFGIDSHYNTYRYYGLPPGPIASPDKTSILAAIYPADVEYLYFVAKPDGTHYFSKTLEEHNKAVWEYQRLPSIEKHKKENNKNLSN